ncbi:MAG: hypothetical protein ACXAD7_00315 [Candidatus Kariarchaeaceae archaeon]
MSIGKPPFVKDVSHDREVPKDSPFAVTLVADWPTPSWSHETTSIDINKEENVVTISYLGTRRPGVAMQALKSFTTEFKLSLPTKTNWTLIVKGRSEDWESRITVV